MVNQVLIVLQFSVPLAIGILAGFYLDFQQWSSIVFQIAIFQSILIAGILFRLGRGLPNLDVEHLDGNDIDKLTSAFRDLAIDLRGMFLISMTTIIVLLFSNIFGSREYGCLWIGLAVFFSVLTIFKSILLVLHDLDLIELQSNLLKERVEYRRNQLESRKIEEQIISGNYDKPEEYGGKMSDD
ncbi:MAG: hypothetical protein OXG15_01200 [Gammaproteobacteria bacterium]|nr:hypothetical protein [Gammaproteobacteria bacterium]